MLLDWKKTWRPTKRALWPTWAVVLNPNCSATRIFGEKNSTTHTREFSCYLEWNKLCKVEKTKSTTNLKISTTRLKSSTTLYWVASRATRWMRNAELEGWWKEHLNYSIRTFIPVFWIDSNSQLCYRCDW